MKGNKKILIIAILLFMISVGFTTYAIYRESATATGTIGAAAWTVNVKKGTGEGAGASFATANLNFTAADINWTTHRGQNGKIAPGDSGTISFTVDATGSEVDVILEAAMGTLTGLPSGMTAEVTSGTNGKQEIGYNTTSMKATVVVTVTWAGAITDTTGASGKDGNDLSVQGTNLSIPVTLTARQKLASD